MSNNALVLKSEKYAKAVEELGKDPLIMIMAIQMVSELQMDIFKIKWDSFEFMLGALKQYNTLGGKVASHIGGIAEAVKNKVLEILLDPNKVEDFLKPYKK